MSYSLCLLNDLIVQFECLLLSALAHGAGASQEALGIRGRVGRTASRAAAAAAAGAHGGAATAEEAVRRSSKGMTIPTV